MDLQDPFQEFGGSAVTPNPFAEFNGQPVSNPFAEFGGQQVGPPPKKLPLNVVAKKDNVTMVRQPIKPPSESEKYYNPENISGYTSGDKRVDFVYNHPWLINTPIIGDKIKEQAYQLAKRSSGSRDIENIDSTSTAKPNYQGGALFGQNDAPRVNLVDQYFGKISLPRSKYKPTSDYMEFLPSVSVKGQFDKKAANGYDMTDMIKDVAGHTKDLDFTKPIYKSNDADSKVAEELGVDLGGHKTGIGFDKDRNLPYVSISDAWDFEPNGYGNKHAEMLPNGQPADGGRAYVESYLMHKAGHPFKVYDRLYFDPKTKQYIPDEKLPPLKR